MGSRFVFLCARVFVASLGTALYFGGSAHAATITVNTTSDPAGSSSDCTLSDAVKAANTNSVFNGCVAGDTAPTIDTIILPTGIFAPTSGNITLDEPTVIQGAGSGLTTITGVFLANGGNNTAHLELKQLSLRDSQLAGESTANTLDLIADHIVFDNAYISLNQYNTGILNSTLTNVRGINGTYMTSYSDAPQVGNLLIQSSEFDGGGADTMLIHGNELANDRIDIRNSIITNYVTGIVNHECSDMVWSPNSVYITDSMIGGNGMKTGIVNDCGHLVVNRTTFHDITGTAIMAWANYQTVNQNDGTCGPQSSSRLEVYNSTFSDITVSGSYATIYPLSIAPWQDTLVTPFIGILTFDSQANPTCSGATQVTDTDITLVHNTFANNTFTAPGSAVLGITNNTVLHSFRVQNNAMQGRAVSGDFSVSGGATTVMNNLTTQPYTGPSAFASAFMTVTDFMLGPLQDNGGAGTGVDLASGRVLTMRPRAGSPLIDAATSAGLAEDERGVTRSLMNNYDVGAVEVTAAEFTADGGVYVPSTTDRLAETGDDWSLSAVLSVVSITSGLGLLRNRKIE